MSPSEEETYRDGVKDKLDKILAQVTKTNGRVRSLEIARGVLIGAISVITALIIPILAAYISAGRL